MAKMKANKYLLPPDLRLYTREEVAAIFGDCSVNTITLLTEIGCIKAIRIGKRYLYSYDSIKKFEKEYESLDVSNRLKAIESFKIVNNRQS